MSRRSPYSSAVPDEKTPLVQPAGLAGSGTPRKYQRTPPPIRRPTRTTHLLISLLILGGFVLYAQRNRSPAGQGVEYAAGGKSLPSWYAICSKDGAKVYTVPTQSGVGATECVVVGDKYVQDTGSLARIRRRWGDKATIGGVDASPAHIRKSGGLKIFYLPPSHSLTPGLVDSHGHPLEYGFYLQLPLQGSQSIAEVVSRVEDFAKSHESLVEEGGWIEGMGWNQNLWPGGDFPTAADLDASPILRGRPISLARVDAHAEWVSGKVLELLGDLPDEVPGGQIVRYPDGTPTGVFLDNAIGLINDIRPEKTEAQARVFLQRVSEDALSKGLTGIHNARSELREHDFFQMMANEGKLQLRFYNMLHCGNPQHFCGDRVQQVHGAGDGRLTVRSVKMFSDGALGSRGAALLEPYSDKPDWTGLMLLDEEKWEPLIRQWHEAGWQVNVHTIGDRANRVAINAMEKVLGEGKGPKDARMRLEHAQIMTPDDLERAAKLGIIGSYQPTHCTSDMWYAEQRLGAERLKGAYAWKSYLNHGGRIALGSDFPVESIDPLKGFYAAVSRLSEEGTSPHGPGGWHAEEKLSREETLRGMTVDAAYASFSNDTGSFELGKRFDAVIWDDDLLTAPINEILEIKAKTTIVDGQIAWGKLRG